MDISGVSSGISNALKLSQPREGDKFKTERVNNSSEVSAVDQTQSKTSAERLTSAPLRPQDQKSSSTEEISQAVEHINDFLQSVKRSLQFSLNEDTGRIVIQVKDIETDQLIRQIPPEDILKLAQNMGQIDHQPDSFSGLLVKEKA